MDTNSEVEGVETWLPVVGFDKYLVSDHGRIMNRESKRLLKPAIIKSFECVTLRRAGKNHGRLVHRLVANAFVGNVSEYEVIHKDGYKLNNHCSNLQVVTQQENPNRWISASQKSIPLRCVETNQEFYSIREAARQLDINAGLITLQLLGLRHSAQGYTFTYIDQANETTRRTPRPMVRPPKISVRINELGLEFESLSKAADYLMISRASVSQQLNGKISSTSGYTFTKLS